jgi:CRP/FNR family transcriptional regulator
MAGWSPGRKIGEDMRQDAPPKAISAQEARAVARSALQTTGPFEEIDQGALEQLLGILVLRTLGPGEVVFLEGTPGDRFFVVASGRLRVFRHVPPATELTIFTLEPGDFFGLLPLLDGGPYPVSVAALTGADILVLHRADFLRFTRANPPFCLALLAYMARRLRGSFERIETLGRQGAVARAAHALLGLIPPEAPQVDGVAVTLPFPQVELARLLHVTEANLSRALTRLRSAGTLRSAGSRRFRITDLAALHRAADGE